MSGRMVGGWEKGATEWHNDELWQISLEITCYLHNGVAAHREIHCCQWQGWADVGYITISSLFVAAGSIDKNQILPIFIIFIRFSFLIPSKMVHKLDAVPSGTTVLFLIPQISEPLSTYMVLAVYISRTRASSRQPSSIFDLLPEPGSQTPHNHSPRHVYLILSAPFSPCHRYHTSRCSCFRL